MPEISRVLVTIPLQGRARARLEAALGGAEQHWIPRPEWKAKSEDERRALVDRIDVALLASPFPRRYLDAPHLRWLHFNQAGLNHSAWPEIFERGLLVTGSSGRSSPALAEHVIFFLLALTYDVRNLVAAQQAGQWIKPKLSAGRSRSLAGQTVGILGVGSIGLEVAKRLSAMGVRTIGYDRDPAKNDPVLDDFFLAEPGALEAMLPQCEGLVLALPLNDGSHRLVGAQELALLPRGSMLVNIGRGAVVDEAAMTEALQTGHLGGAGLDVFTREPLPQSSPLWELPNVVITPHFTPPLPDRGKRALDMLCENIDRYRRDDTLLNLLRPDDVYSG